jgi:hypothetical protein
LTVEWFVLSGQTDCKAGRIHVCRNNMNTWVYSCVHILATKLDTHRDLSSNPTPTSSDHYRHSTEIIRSIVTKKPTYSKSIHLVMARFWAPPFSKRRCFFEEDENSLSQIFYLSLVMSPSSIYFVDLKCFQIVCNLERCFGLALDLVLGNTICNLDECESFREINIENGLRREKWC